MSWATRVSSVCLLSLVCVTLATAQDTLPYRFRVLDLPVDVTIGGITRSTVVRFTDLNTQFLLGNDGAGDGFIVTLPQTLQEIHCPDEFGGDATEATAVNNVGEIVGSCAVAQPQPQQVAFVRSVDGQFTLVRVPDADWTLGNGINDIQQVVGQYGGLAGVGLHRLHGFLWDRGIFTTVDAPFPEAMATTLLGINGVGQMIGTFLHHRPGSPDANDYDAEQAFLYDLRTGQYTLLEVPGAQLPVTCCGATTFPMDINTRGDILIATYAPDRRPAFVIYREGRFLTITGVPPTVLAGYDFSLIHGASAWGMNDAGALAGTYLEQIPCPHCGEHGEDTVQLVRHGFLAKPVRPAPDGVGNLVAGDFDGDGIADAAGLSKRGEIWVGITGLPWRQIPGTLATLVSGDFDGNGVDDLAGLTRHGAIWVSTDMARFRQVNGWLTTLVACRCVPGNSRSFLAGLSGHTIWFAPALNTWRELGGRLQTLIAGDFLGAGYEQLAGEAPNTTLWIGRTVGAWESFAGPPKNLMSLYPVEGTPAGMWGEGRGHTYWYAPTLGAWRQFFAGGGA